MGIKINPLTGVLDIAPADNFGYENIEAADFVFVAFKQQMMIGGLILIDGSLMLDGTLAVV